MDFNRIVVSHDKAKILDTWGCTITPWLQLTAIPIDW
jgi:hypothetical protein